MRVLFLFVDGVGVGADDPRTNPFARVTTPNLWAITCGRPTWSQGTDGHGALVPSLDAQLGVDGLPQSATGQAALLTGRNAPQEAGRHVGPYPTAALRSLLAAEGLFRRATDLGYRVTLANAYPDRYLDRAGRGTARMGAVARAAWSAGVRLRGPSDLRAGRAVSASLHNEPWRERLGYRDMAAISPRDAGTALAGLVASHDLTVFETYGTDVAGHRQDMELAATVLTELDAFVGGLADALATDAVVVLASDHGNVEDLSTRRHTTNRALAGWRGPLAPPRLEALTDVAPAILQALATPARDGDTVAGGGASVEPPEPGAEPAR